MESNQSDIPENTGELQVDRKPDGTFSPGQSGNPSGKPKGAKNKTTLAAKDLLEGEAESLSKKAIELALNGDVTALRICLDRIAPSLKSTAPTVHVEIDESLNLADIAKTFVREASKGKIAPDIAAQLVSAVASVARVEEMESIKERLQSLERAIKERKS